MFPAQRLAMHVLRHEERAKILEYYKAELADVMKRLRNW